LVPDLLQLARIVRVLYDRFPKGTPLDELDIDIVEQLDPAEDFKRPIVRLWAIRLLSQIVEAVVVSPAPSPASCGGQCKLQTLARAVAGNPARRVRR
jgi:hypothetical protein